MRPQLGWASAPATARGIRDGGERPLLSPDEASPTSYPIYYPKGTLIVALGWLGCPICMGLPSLIRPVGSRAAAAGTLVDDLRELAQARERQVSALWDALERFRPSDLFASLSSVVGPLPLVVDADCAMVRVCDDQAMLHLVAASGCVARE